MPNAVFYDVLTTIQTKLQARGLVDENGVALPSGAFVLQKIATNRPKDIPAPETYPCILIAPWGAETINPASGTNSRDDIAYKVLVCILANDENDQSRNLNLYLTWRESIRNLFNQQRLSATLVFKVEVTPLSAVDQQAWTQKNLFASGMILNCYSRETRG